MNHAVAPGRIVVGVDGSRPSREALRWALEEARLRGLPVEAVHAWRYPVMTYAPGIMAPPTYARADLEDEARKILDASVDAVAGEAGAEVPTDRVVVEGAAAEELVKRCGPDDLLVVGHRGRGGFMGLLLGSVAEQCSTHTRCPVVIVRSAGSG